MQDLFLLPRTNVPSPRLFVVQRQRTTTSLQHFWIDTAIATPCFDEAAELAADLAADTGVARYRVALARNHRRFAQGLWIELCHYLRRLHPAWRSDTEPLD